MRIFHLLGGPLDGAHLQMVRSAEFEIQLPVAEETGEQKFCIYQQIASTSSDYLYVFVREGREHCLLAMRPSNN